MNINWEGCLKGRRIIDVFDCVLVDLGQGNDKMRVVQMVTIIDVMVWNGCAGKDIKCGRGLRVERLCGAEGINK